MRTLVVVRSLKMGGMERVAVNLADSLAAAGHETHMVTWRQRDQVLAPDHGAVQLHMVPIKQRVRRSVSGAVMAFVSRLLLNPLIRRSHFVWVGKAGGEEFSRWLEDFEREHGAVDRIIFRGLGTFELVWGFQDSRARYVLENRIDFKGPHWKQRLFARCLLQGKHLVAVSDDVAQGAREIASRLNVRPAHVETIVNACPIAQIRQQAMLDEPDIPDEPFILNVARLVCQKDHALLLRAYALANPQERLVIVGAGPKLEELQSLAEQLGISERVIFAGQRANPYAWMRAARLFVLSSRVEGMGIVLMEALACGTPVVSVDCRGGVREILKGELEQAIAPHSAEGLATRMNELLASGGYSVRDEWLEDFCPQTMVRRFLADPARPVDPVEHEASPC
ncbi:glycosyltransferase [Cobetia sp. L2A1]|uniref:glycosyltransferase n=1 Tax=Cobetia sp. L2A1 TaxID=2686360 RepID=UPI001E34564F|nr:glycosyltransferase [Cobetia sp. L2A1]